jgi:hypothetical protein
MCIHNTGRFDPEVARGTPILLSESPSKGTSLLPSPAAEENPTSADWPP